MGHAIPLNYFESGMQEPDMLHTVCYNTTKYL